jgi:hypothetical protein
MRFVPTHICTIEGKQGLAHKDLRKRRRWPTELCSNRHISRVYCFLGSYDTNSGEWGVTRCEPV